MSPFLSQREESQEKGLTRKHYSRMRTARLLTVVCVCVCVCVSESWGCPGGVCDQGGVTRGVCDQVMYTPQTQGQTPPMNRMTDRQVKKHYLPATSFAGGKDRSFLR